MMTRIFIPVLIFVFASCSKEERKQRLNLHPTGYAIEIGINEKTSDGQIIEHDAPVSVIHVWKADNKNYEILSVGDAVSGYATDKSSDRLESAYFTALSSHALERATQGKYFVFVMLDESPATGKFAYSYSTFEVIQGEQTKVKKIFTSRISNSQYEDWNASE